MELESAGRLKFLLMELVVSRVEQIAQLNAELLRSNEELDAFAYVASHDLKEPLRGIYKYAHQLIEAEPAEPEATRSRLDSIMRLALRMDNLLDSLLHFSQLGHADLRLENVDLNEVLAEALEMIGSRTPDPATAIAVPRPMPVAACDPVRLREVFVNLLSNALKYNDKPIRQLEVGYFGPKEAGRPLDFPASAAGQTLYYVKDNGIGIESRHFEQVFKVFKRLHGLGEFGGGTGAGLTIVRMLIQRHGGEIWLESKPGHGCTFYFSLSSAGNV